MASRYPGTFKRSGAWSYRAQFQEPDGERWGVSGAGHLTAKDAYEARAAAIHNARTARLAQDSNRQAPEDVTLEQHMRTWLATQALTIRPATESSYRGRIDAIAKSAVSKLPLRSITETQYRELVAEVSKGVGHGTALGRLMTLKAALSAAVRSGALPENPAEGIRLSRRTERFRATIWDVDQATTFLQHRRAARDPLFLAYHLALVTGMRKGELHGLKREDFDLDSGVVHLRRQRTQVRGAVIEGPLKTDGSEDTVHLDAATVALIRRHTWVSDYLVTMPGTTRPYVNMATFRKHWRAAAKAASVPEMRFHDLRHTTASMMAAAGVPLAAAQRRLRHWSPVMTRRYTQIHDTVAQQVAEKLGALLTLPEETAA